MIIRLGSSISEVVLTFMFINMVHIMTGAGLVIRSFCIQKENDLFSI